jgi:superfamily I DNA/RNA helicase
VQQMKFFLDTHDQRSQTFPAGITREQFAEFFASYEKICREEGVVVLRVHVGFDEGRAYCFNMAPSADHVRKAHERAGLPFDTITEVTTATPGDLFFRPQAA